MRSTYRFALLVGAAALFPRSSAAQRCMTEDTSHVVANGGVKAAGWTGVVDPGEAACGRALKDQLFAAEGGGFHVTTGPATTYWNPANAASGNYTVKATFTEPKFMGRYDHPHPYGVFIGGNALGTATQTLLYCEAYGNGGFIVRGFNPAPFSMGRRQTNEAVHKAAAPGQPVTQEIAMSVKDGAVSCSVNGTVVATFPKDSVVMAGRLKSTNGTYGVRAAHDVEITVTGFAMTKDK